VVQLLLASPALAAVTSLDLQAQSSSSYFSAPVVIICKNDSTIIFLYVSLHTDHFVKRFNWRGWLKVQPARKRDGESGILGLPARIAIGVVAGVPDWGGGWHFPPPAPPQTDATDLL